MRIKYSIAALVLGISVMAALVIPSAYSIRAQTEADVAAREAQLKAELEQVLKEIDDQQKVLDVEKQKGASLERDIAILNAQISKAQLNIKARNLAIAALGKDITQKDQTIKELQGKIESNKDSLAQLLRKTNEIDSYNLVNVVLSSQSLSDFFIDADALDSIKESIGITMGTIKKSKSDTEVAKQQLDKKRLEEINARISIEDEQAKIKASEQEKARLLNLSKAQQQNYQSVISSKQAKAASIRAALFSLRDTAAIPFGKAFEYATEASKATGIRPAFLLAILQQESNLGANVGSCLVTDLATGNGIGKNTGSPFEQVMKAPRDTVPFVNITAALGRDWKSTPVSCPIGSPKYYVGRGFGGAMGPAQFIPSTWMLFNERLKKVLGTATPDPWAPEDAFMASAMYLSDLGAGSGTYVGELIAACKYYGSGGTTCAYGTQVQARAINIQVNMIDPLSGI